MVTGHRWKPLRFGVAPLVVAWMIVGVAPGCLINPKDYPLAADTAGSSDGVGEAGADSSRAGSSAFGGGATSVGGHAGSSSRGGMTGVPGGSGGSTGGISTVGGTGGALEELAGAAPESGGDAGAPADNGGAPTDTAGRGGSSYGGAGFAGGAGVGIGTAGGSGVPAVKRVFVTSQTFDGNFKAYGSASDPDGLNGADAICNQKASQAGLGGSWIAWLSVTGKDAINRVADVAPWYLVDGVTRAFDDHAQLGASANVPVNVTEHGDTVAGSVWTGTTLLGTAQSARCGEWKNNGTTLGAWGDTGNAFDWSYKDTQYCSKAAHIYCFEQ